MNNKYGPYMFDGAVVSILITFLYVNKSLNICLLICKAHFDCVLGS